jgi:hypothetical protein
MPVHSFQLRHDFESMNDQNHQWYTVDLFDHTSIPQARTGRLASQLGGAGVVAPGVVGAQCHFTRALANATDTADPGIKGINEPTLGSSAPEAVISLPRDGCAFLYCNLAQWNHRKHRISVSSCAALGVSQSASLPTALGYNSKCRNTRLRFHLTTRHKPSLINHQKQNSETRELQRRGMHMTILLRGPTLLLGYHQIVLDLSIFQGSTGCYLRFRLC